MVKSQIRLGDADLAVLRHVARHSMTTEQVLALAPEMNGCSRDSAKKRLQRLRKAGYLHSAPLFENRYYYHLSKNGANCLGEPVRDRMHLSDDAKIRAYAGLIFCTDPQTKCHKQSATEFKQRFPALWQPGMRLDYYLNTADPQQVRLGFYRVDYTPNSRRWSYIIPRIQNYVSKRCDNPEFRKYILSGQFEITIITALQDKADALKLAFVEAELPATLAIQYYVVEDLLPLIAPQGS